MVAVADGTFLGLRGFIPWFMPRFQDMLIQDMLTALNAIAGFVATGALVVLFVAMMPDPKLQPVHLASVHDGQQAVSLDDPRPLQRPDRRALRAPLMSPRTEIARPREPSIRAPIPADSIATLVENLRARQLELPVAGIGPEGFHDDFDDPRPGGRTHEALDILAPRGTLVRAVEDGTIASLDPSQGGGGIVVYQYDPSGEFVYYYAHLESYVDGLEEGQEVERGDVLGFVGTSGNAPPDVPHLHFAIYKTPASYRWWKGTPINPYAVLH